MNERIRELAEQAKAESSQWLGSKPATTITYDELEKFAELIVAECLVDFYRRYLDITSNEDITDQVARYVKQHFGVGE